MSVLNPDVCAVMLGFAWDPRSGVRVCRLWAEAVAALGRASLPGRCHPPHATGPSGDSYLRLLHYMTIGLVAPNPGRATFNQQNGWCRVWPFPVPAAWRPHLVQEFAARANRCDAYTDEVKVLLVRSPDSRTSPLVEGLASLKELRGAQFETDSPETVAFADRIYSVVPSLSKLEYFYRVGPHLVTYPKSLVSVAPSGPLLAAYDCGMPLCDSVNGWYAGAQAAHPAATCLGELRRVTDTCLVLVDYVGNKRRKFYFAAVIWYTRARGLRVKRFDCPDRCDLHVGWDLPPLDADQYALPAFVIPRGRQGNSTQKPGPSGSAKANRLAGLFASSLPGRNPTAARFSERTLSTGLWWCKCRHFWPWPHGFFAKHAKGKK